MRKKFKFDILVVGGGHSGLEAAYISSKFGLKVGMVTLESVPIASAPCNPSIGGVGKGQVVREIDALGGVMGILADKAGIQYRTLNTSKGFAVNSTRLQIDKVKYPIIAEEILNQIPNISILKDEVQSINKRGDAFEVYTDEYLVCANKLIVTTGTFLNGKLYQGNEISSGGRMDAMASNGLKTIFSDVKTRPKRFKTGTPARLIKDSINWSKLDKQPSDHTVRNFHLLHNWNERFSEQVDCFIAYTNEKTIQVIHENIKKSPMFNGKIEGVGARYCPSIEDKVFRYPQKHQHHIFLEPESLSLDTIYPSGISSSLPKDVQLKFLRTIEGLENVEVETYGYAVEYDVVDTSYLSLGLEHQDVHGLYFAGQINGTSGYEEAAAQGLIAGINASLAITKPRTDLFSLSRKDTYIGVMIEDLVVNERDEPYRLFTARAENRLFIREDNTFLRIKKYTDLLNLDDPVHLKIHKLSKDYDLLDSYFHGENKHFEFLSKNIKNPSINPVSWFQDFMLNHTINFDKDVWYTYCINHKYSGYLDRAKIQLSKMSKNNDRLLDINSLIKNKNISFECKQRINKIRPNTFGQLKKINGIRPSTVAYISTLV